MHLDYRDARPIYLQLKDALMGQIHSGILREGDRLPSVRELAAELAINPNTIQRAYRELEAEGYTVSIPGKGSFVQETGELARAKQRELLRDFDRAAEALLALGMSREELARRLGAARKEETP